MRSWISQQITYSVLCTGGAARKARMSRERYDASAALAIDFRCINYCARKNSRARDSLRTATRLALAVSMVHSF